MAGTRWCAVTRYGYSGSVPLRVTFKSVSKLLGLRLKWCLAQCLDVVFELCLGHRVTLEARWRL